MVEALVILFLVCGEPQYLVISDAELYSYGTIEYHTSHDNLSKYLLDTLKKENIDVQTVDLAKELKISCL